MNMTLITAVAGLFFGLVGAILGILNTWRAFDRDRPKVRVVPHYQFYSTGGVGIGIQLTNLSPFPIVIQEIGFTLPGHKKYFLGPGAFMGCELPERMEMRTSFTVTITAPVHNRPEWKSVRKAYAMTACGETFTGTSGALRQMIRAAARS